LSTTHRVTLSAIPNGNENSPVTRSPDGTVLSWTFDIVWDFSGQEQGSVRKAPTVSFKKVDETYRQDIQATLALIMRTYRDHERKNASSNQVQNWLYGLTYIRKGLGSSDWARLSDDILYKRFKGAIKKRIQSGNWSKTPVNYILTALGKLRVSGLTARNPERAEFLSWVTKETEQHIAIPIGMYQSIIAHAVEVVETYHPHREEINSAHARLEEIYQEEKARTDVSFHSLRNRMVKRGSTLQHSIPNYKPARSGADLRKIICGCQIATLAFSGVRVGELLSMNKYSYEERGVNAIPTLKGEETKRLGQVVRETWQTHSMVRDALELAYDSTQYLRDLYEARNNDKLDNDKISSEKHKYFARQISSAFLNRNPTVMKSSYCETNTNRMFNDFIASSGIVATQADVEEFDRLNPSREGQLKVGRTLPKLTPHDFRRSFAVFFKRYGFGSSASIKFQYKHRNINMSDYYGNNARLQAMEDVLLDHDLLNQLNEEGIRMGVDIFDEIYNESEQLGGAGGERIAKDKFERLSSGEQVYMTRSEIERLVRNGTLSVVKLPTGGYCMNATCSRICGIGEFTTEIKPCEHQVITENQAKVILRQNKRIIKAFREMNTGDPMMNSILIGQKQKVKRNEQMIKDFNLSFEPFDDKIKGVIETLGA